MDKESKSGPVGPILNETVIKLNKDYVTAFLKTIFFTLEKKSSILVNPYTTFTLGKSYLINRFFKFL